MRSIFLLAFVSFLLSPSKFHAQTDKKSDIEVSSAVLKTAEWANFKYMENLNLAKTGDVKAIKAFLEFSGTVDGVESLEHATTCIELIPFSSDMVSGAVISTLKPKLQKVLLERFVLAQGRTKKEALRKPLQEWAPLCWKALNGEKVAALESGQAKSDPNRKTPVMAKPKVSKPALDSGKQ
ncbi:MAG: hypothetical protein ACKVU0_01725 [Saprospiraceae bacterium]